MADAISDVGDMPQCHSADGSPRLEGVVDENPEYLTLEERLQELQKLAVIGQLAGGVAHDFNNSISATLIHLGLLLKDPQLTAT
jgi:signal transduction histidine kinase